MQRNRSASRDDMRDQALPREAQPRSCAPGIWQIPLPLPGSFLGTVNVYVVEDSEGVTLVDCGLGNGESWDLLRYHLDALRIPLRHVARVLLTHTHHDHSGLAARIVAETRAAVWVHQHDLDFYRRRYVEADAFQRRVNEWLRAHGTPAAEAQQLANGSLSVARGAGELPVMETYRPGDGVAIGEYEFDIVWTPGHTPGHVCFMDHQKQTLICGDHILPRASPNVGMHVDTEVNPLGGYLASLEEIATSSFATALPGHGAPSSEIQTRARELWNHHTGRQRLVREILSVETLTAYELGARVWAETRPNRWSDLHGHLRRNAIGTLVAHAELLCEHGVLDRTANPPYRYGRA